MLNLTGQVRWDCGRPYVRIRLGGDKRPLLRLAVKTQQEAEKRAAFVSDVVGRLRDAEKDELVEKLARRAASAKTAADLAGVKVAVDAVCGDEVSARPQFDEGTTFEEFATKWTDGTLHTMYPRRIRAKRSAKDDAGFLRKWVFPHIGSIPLIALTSDHCEEVLAHIPEESVSVHVTRQVAQVMARTLRLAVFPAKLIKVCPVGSGFVPPIMDVKARTYLFPDEDRLLLKCKDIYLPIRLLYGVLAREGMRVDEALSLGFSDLDLRNGIVMLDRNKTNDPRTWALNPDVVAALKLWRDHFHPHPTPTERVFVYPLESRQAGKPLQIRKGIRADTFREHLRAAGCRRSQLYEDNATRRPIRMHDLRATFVTIALATGKTESWVSARTGHRSSTMINEYRRLASCHKEVRMTELDSLVQALPEFAARLAPADHAAE